MHKPPVKQFMAELEQSIQEAHSGAVGRRTEGEEIARRSRGRPTAAVHKAPMTLRMEPDALERWRASGKGWQTRAAALLAAQAPKRQALTDAEGEVRELTAADMAGLRPAAEVLPPALRKTLGVRGAQKAPKAPK